MLKLPTQELHEHPELCSSAVKNLLKYLNNSTPLSNLFIDKISPMLAGQVLTKRFQMVLEGKVADVAYWLDKGYAKFYKIDHDSDGIPFKRTIDICKPGKILVDCGGFFNDLPSGCFIEIAANSVIVPFAKSDFFQLEGVLSEANTLASKILALEIMENRAKADILRLKPRERYEGMITFFGEAVTQYVTGKDIAQYLSICPKYLSRLRGEIKRKK
jgi:CRP-like cAMP-binding protein